MDKLLKKHEGFDKTLEAQEEEKISTLEQLAQALLDQKHYAAKQIKDRLVPHKSVHTIEHLLTHPPVARP